MAAARVLLSTANGAGLGHLTRVMAGGRRLPDSVLPVVATQSLGAGIVLHQDFPLEYVVSWKTSGFPSDRWTAYLEQRYEHLLDVYRPDVVVYDGVVPYRGMTAAMARSPAQKVWLRRGLWRQGVGRQHLALGEVFDHVVEPGDVAQSADVGVTAGELGRTIALPPVTYLDEDELLEPAAAQRVVCGREDDRLVLMSLGAGNINDTTSLTATVTHDLLRRGFTPVVTVSPIGTPPVGLPDGVRMIQEFPVSRLLRGFAFAVIAAGYNSVHEAVLAGTPSLVVPNLQTGLDDQLMRAAYLEERGAAVMATDLAAVPAALDVLEHGPAREAMRAALERLRRPNGAAALAGLVAGLAGCAPRLGPPRPLAPHVRTSR
jgi:UDP:flavonoid glycosyltransferase YjiC (YdhE family)